MKTGRICKALAALVLCLSGCEKRVGSEPSAAQAARVVAEYGDVRVTLAEVDASIRDELYRARGEGLHNLLMQRLEKLEAAKRGITVEQLRNKAVDSRIEAPSEAKLQQFFSNARDQGMLEPGATLESARPEIMEMLTMGQRRELQEEYLDMLLLGYGVRMHFDVLGRPKVAFRDGGPSVGPADAPITIVEFTDFKQRFCREGNEILGRVIAAYPKQVRVLFRHKPEPNDEVAERAAESALCANEQGRYWDYRTALFVHQDALGADQLIERAKEVGLDVGRFKQCVETHAQRQAVEADVAEASGHGLDGTPVTALNGTPLSGVHDFRFYRRLIELELPPAKVTAATTRDEGSAVAQSR